MDTDAIRQWLSVLDRLSYYELLRIPSNAPFDDVKRAFHVFADSFHPDSHATRPQDERDAIARIFKRGTEAYRVLSEPDLRFQYDQALASNDPAAQAVIVGMQREKPTGSIAPGPQRLIDKLRTPAARPFVIRAEELFKKGDPKQAKLQLTLAMHMDPNNPALDAFAKELEVAVKKKEEESKSAWKKP